MKTPADRLRFFLQTKMTMSHVYQPVMIQTILDSGGAATRRQIAKAIAAADFSQIEYYEQVIARYPGPVLRKHGVVDVTQGIYALTADFNPRTEWERAELSAICSLRVAEFLSSRQDRLWAGRTTNLDPVPGSLRWQVIHRALGRCEACGISSADRAIEVDHINPRARGGTNELWNLQALCSLCNVQKLDGEPVNFHAAHQAAQERHEGCELCRAEPFRNLENELAVVLDLAQGLVVAPKRHGVSYADLWQSEVNALRYLEKALSKMVIGMTDMSSSMVPCSDTDVGHLAVALKPAERANSI